MAEKANKPISKQEATDVVGGTNHACNTPLQQVQLLLLSPPPLHMPQRAREQQARAHLRDPSTSLDGWERAPSLHRVSRPKFAGSPPSTS